MTISKKFLKHEIKDCKEMIEAHREQAKTFPILKKANAIAIARLEGKIAVYEYFLGI
tara:strand:+ start:97 stop:267 length:171 start_codon:yes stop_codon:yes gene_type:complete